MAVIALSGNTMSCALGMGSFESIGNAFTSAKNSAGGLSGALKSLRSKIDMASIATNVSASQEQASQAHGRETEKQSTLSLAYGKLESLISNVGIVDDKASSKIHQRKNDFYNRYNYLKPDCEKSDKELKAERRAEKWENFKNWCSGVVESAKNFIKNVCDWCKEHWKDILKVLAVVALVVASVLLLVFVPGGGLLSAILLGAAKGCLIGLATSVAMNGIINKCNGRGFWEGSIDAAFSGAVGGFIGGGITGGLFGNAATFGKTATKGLLKMAGSFWGSVGQGALAGSISTAASNAGVTALTYWIENGTLNGASGTILQNAFSGAISGGILGGIMSGVGFKIQEYKNMRLQQLNSKETDLSNALDKLNSAPNNKVGGEGFADDVADMIGKDPSVKSTTREVPIDVTGGAQYNTDIVVEYYGDEGAVKLPNGGSIDLVEVKASDTATYQNNQKIDFHNNNDKLIGDAFFKAKGNDIFGNVTIPGQTPVIQIKPSIISENIKIERIGIENMNFGLKEIISLFAH